MTRDKKYWLKKQSEDERAKLMQNMTDDEIKIYDKAKEFTKKFDVMLKDLHLLMFEEEYDYMYDSNTDANERAKGINPMSQEYIEKVNCKRMKLGINPYSVEVNTMNVTLNYCKDIITGKINILMSKYK